MSMEVSNAYNNYVSSYVNEQNVRHAKATKSLEKDVKVDTTKETGATKQTQSSQDYLSNLRKKYSDINITVADFKSEKQELSYMFGRSGGNNIVISQSVIDKMAKDPATAAKYEKVIADVPNAAKDIKERIESEPGCKVIASGVKIDKDGKVTYWTIGSKTGEGPGTKEKMQKQLKEMRAKKQKEKKLEAEKLEKEQEKERIDAKHAEKRAEEKARMELMLTKADNPEDLVSKFEAGEAETVSVDNMAAIGAGSKLNVTV